MPPASLSTFAVMMPGPRIARKSVRRAAARSGRPGAAPPRAAGSDHRSLRRWRFGSGWSRSTTSSIVMIPIEDALGVRHGQREEVVLRHRLGDVVGRDVRRDAPDGRRHDLLEQCRRPRRRGGRAPRARRGAILALVDDVEVEEDLGVARDGREALERLRAPSRSGGNVTKSVPMRPPAVFSSWTRSSVTSSAASFSMSWTRSRACSPSRSPRTSAASSAGICSRISEARLSGRSSMISAWISGSSSCSVSAAVSTSSFRKMPVRSVPETWLEDVRDVGRMEALELLLRQRRLEAVELRVERLHRVPRDEPRRQRARRRGARRAA